ncbi:MAG: hypothetical protein AB1894_17335 [Chloroflexota bacterium]
MIQRIQASRSRFAVLISSAVIIGLLGLLIYARSADNKQSLNDIKGVLSDYRESLSTGQILHPLYYTSAMQDLIRERRIYYEDYFAIGLYSTLESIQSEYVIDDEGSGIEVTVISKDRLSVQVKEYLILQGRPKGSPEENPVLLALRWALSRADNECMKLELENEIQSSQFDFNKYHLEGFETRLEEIHQLVMERTPNGLQIIQDSIQSMTEGGPASLVVWVNGNYIWNKPDFTQMPDYQRHIMSIDELGRAYLEKVSRGCEQ